MTESERKEIVEFCQNLGQLRQQVGDGGLLDKCQTFLVQLLMLSQDCALDPDPVEEPSA